MFERELKEAIEGEVHFDKTSRQLYATDASNYEIEPLGLVLPFHDRDVKRTMEIAHRRKVPILPRGAGTSLAGQTVGKALIIDLSRYCSQILEVNPEEKWVRVQPGVVLDELNDHLRAWNLYFPIDTATSNRANIGGLIGNNSCGAHSLVYGKTVDHVLEIKALLAGGREVLFHRYKEKQDHPVAQFLQRELEELLEPHREEIKKRYPSLMRRVGGYNLDEFIAHPQAAGLARLIVGSEGTLAMVTEARLNLVTPPGEKAILLLHFDALSEALCAVAPLLDQKPYALELLDRLLLDLAASSDSFSPYLRHVQGKPQALLLLEFAGKTSEEVKSKVEKCKDFLSRKGLGGEVTEAWSERDREEIWKLRKAGLPILLSQPRDTKPQTFVEDTAVAPEKLPQYVADFQKILKKYNTTASFYAHASVGCLHIRPLLNLKTVDGVYNMQDMASEVVDLVLKYGGSMSAEHGDGLVRSSFNQKYFGPQIYRIFEKVKSLFDPNHLMNPGKIVGPAPMTQSLRYGPFYSTRKVDTFLDFSPQKNFATSVELCNGSGVCRKKTEGVMCPSFMVTEEEKHSTRGRANLLRHALRSDTPHQRFTSRDLYEAMDLCLNCKGCKRECPSAVDMAKIKEEFLYHYYRRHPRPLRDQIFNYIHHLSRWGSHLAPLSNFFFQKSLLQKVGSRLVGLASQSEIPPFASTSLRRWWKNQKSPSSRGQPGKKALLFADTFTNYYSPEIGRSAISLLKAAGYEVRLTSHGCCGRPRKSKGFLTGAKKLAQKNLRLLLPWVEKGYQIVGCEPSCLLTLREYPQLIPSAEAKKLAQNSYLLQEVLAREEPLPYTSTTGEFLYHGHCHEKSEITTAPTLSLLAQIPDATITPIESTCCGMAGSFGMEREHEKISLEIGELRLFPAVRAQPEAEILASGFSCRQQIRRGTGRKARHFAEILADSLPSTAGEELSK